MNQYDFPEILLTNQKLEKKRKATSLDSLEEAATYSSPVQIIEKFLKTP